MKESSGSRRRKLEKIGFEELMGAAGMSGFGALLEPPPVRATGGWRLPVELRMRFSLQGAALAERLVRQNDILRSLNGSMVRRVTSLEQALVLLSRITALSRCDAIPPRSETSDPPHLCHSQGPLQIT